MTSQSISQCCKNSFKTQNVIRHLKILKQKILQTSHLIPIKKIRENIFINNKNSYPSRTQSEPTCDRECLFKPRQASALAAHQRDTEPAARACAVLDTANADAVKQDKRIRATESHFKTSRNSLGEFFHNLYNWKKRSYEAKTERLTIHVREWSIRRYHS